MSADTAEGPVDGHSAEYLRRLVRVELVDARTAIEMTQKEMAKRLGWSISKAVRIEQGAVSVAPSDVRAMMSLFGADEDQIGILVGLALKAREADDWSEFDDVLSPSYKELIGQEQSAQSITKYEANVVPGLFQTEAYALALSSALRIAPDTAERIVKVRMRRQAILERKSCPEINAVIGEVALVRHAGTPEVMNEQLEHLIEVASQPRINVFVMPFSAGVHVGIGVPFTLLRFADPRLDDVVYLEDARVRTTSSEDSEIVAEHFQRFALIEAIAESTGSLEAHARRILQSRYS